MTKPDFSNYSKEELKALLDKAFLHIHLIEGKVDALVRRIYGAKSEVIDPNQLEILLKGDPLGKGEAPCPEAEQGAMEITPKVSCQRKSKHAPRTHEHLSVEEEILDPEEVKENPEAWRFLSQEVSEQLDYEPGRFFKRRTICRRYLKRDDKEHPPVIAPLPEKLQERCLAAPGLLAHVVVNKYGHHLPLYRQEQIFKQRDGVEIARQTMVRWVELVADWMNPIYEQMKKKLLGTKYIQVDETPIKYLDPGRGRSAQGYFWTYKDPTGDVLFDWHPSRATGCLKSMLGEGFQGVIQCDGYQVYQSFSKGRDKIKLAGCWAHARRKFFEATEEAPRFAGWIIHQIGLLYQIEKSLRQTRAGPTLRTALRASQSQFIVHRLFKALKKKLNRYLPQSRMGKAIAYTLHLQVMLEQFLKDGRIEIDNNLVENAIRPTALGKKNWLFIGDVRAGQRSAILYSILESCRRRGIEPYGYLREILERLPTMTNKQVYELTPEYYQYRHLKKSA